MFENYIKVAYRNLIRNKLYSIISVIGLGVGIACCLLIFLYVHDELTFDTFHENTDNIYRVIQFEDEEGLEAATATPTLLAGELKAQFPEVQAATRIADFQNTVKSGEKSFVESIALVDPAFFQMFSFPLIQGDPTTILNNPSSVVITPQMAEKYFQRQDPIGKSISIQLGETFLDFLVSGIIEKAPSNSSIQYDFLASTEHLKYTYPERLLNSWNIILFPTLIQLTPGTDQSVFETKLRDFSKRMFEEEKRGGMRSFRLQPLRDIHLNPNLGGISVPSSDPVYSYILSAIAIAVLLIACINFMSLTVGRSSSRAREVGLRKVLGAQRSQLMKQFWGEALLLSAAALILGIALTEAFLPTFNNLAEKQLTFDLFSNHTLIPALLGLMVVTAFVAGIYPSLLLSRLMPVNAFRGNIRLGGKNRLIQSLVVLQFAISVFLIASTIIIASQLNYVKKQNLGYDQELVVTFPSQTEGEDAANLLTRFRNSLSEHPEIIGVTGYSYAFADPWLYMGYDKEGGRTILIGEDITSPGFPDAISGLEGYFYTNWVDPNFIPTMGINIVEGRNFSDNFPSDAQTAIINQTTAKTFGWDDPVGQLLPGGLKDTRVIGVMEDFHFYPLHRKIEPLVFHLPRHDFLGSINQIAVRIRPDNIPGTISLIEKTWGDISNGMPFNYSFLDDRVAGQYASEQRWRRIVEYSSIFAFVVACLGLFGLTSLAVAKRTREVGIRKVLGASIARIVMLFSSDFARLVIIANLIACPVAYIVMNRWLQDFAYRTHVSIGIFLLTAILALAIALMTVSFQAIRAALSNPVDSLRYE